MTTEQTPEQRARAGVHQWCDWVPEAYCDAERTNAEQKAALDRLCAERYAAGRMDATEHDPECGSVMCLRCFYEAEYEAAVAALEADTR